MLVASISSFSHNILKCLLFRSEDFFWLNVQIAQVKPSPQKVQILTILGKLFISLPNDKFLDWSKLKEFADDNFKFDENGIKFSIRVENTVGKGEIAHYKIFLLFPQCFKKTCTGNQHFFIFPLFYIL